jgi:hypothetical protein
MPGYEPGDRRIRIESNSGVGRIMARKKIGCARKCDFKSQSDCDESVDRKRLRRH